MKNLLLNEWLKIRKLRATWIIVIIYVVLLPAWMYIMNFWFSAMNRGIHLFPDSKVIWTFPKVWLFTTYSSSYFNILFSILIIILITNEFQNKTLRQHIIDGMTKPKAILSKFLVILPFSLFVTLYATTISLVFGLSQSSEIDLYSNIHAIFFLFVQTLCYFGMAFFLAILIKRPAISILLYIGILFSETIVGLIIPRGVYSFFPMNVISKLTPSPILRQFAEAAEKTSVDKTVILEPWQIISYAIGLLLLFLFAAYLLLKKRDL